MSPWEIEGVVQKLESQGLSDILLTERGFSFGYQQLIADMRSIPIMQKTGYPVCFDAAHAVQKPGKGQGLTSSGDACFIPTLARSAVAAGANVIFLEAHASPADGLSDRESMIPFDQLDGLVRSLLKIYAVVQEECFTSLESV